MNLRRTTSVLGALGALLVGGVALGVPRDEAPAAPASVAAAPLPGAPAAADTPVDVDLLLRRYDAEERAITTELGRIDQALATLDERVVARGRTHYRHVRAGLLPAGGGFEELVDHAARVERTRLALTRDLDEQASLRKQRTALADRLTRIKADRGPLEVHRQAMHRARAALRQADERRMAFDRAFESSTAPPDYVAIYGADLGPSDGAASQGFATQQGRLPLPVSGRTEVRKIDKQGVVGPALELRAGRSATARTIAPGRVVFADRHEDELITVIVDHGDKYFGVYGNLTRADVAVGDPLDAGAPLGPVAHRPHEGTVLWFELRQGGHAIDPAPWFGL